MLLGLFGLVCDSVWYLFVVFEFVMVCFGVCFAAVGFISCGGGALDHLFLGAWWVCWLFWWVCLVRGFVVLC